LTAEAAFPFLGAKVACDPEQSPVLASVVIERPGEPKVAVLGLTTPELTTATIRATSKASAWRIRSPSPGTSGRRSATRLTWSSGSSAPKAR
jgi:hypothetical protein